MTYAPTEPALLTPPGVAVLFYAEDAPDWQLAEHVDGKLPEHLRPGSPYSLYRIPARYAVLARTADCIR